MRGAKARGTRRQTGVSSLSCLNSLGRTIGHRFAGATLYRSASSVYWARMRRHLAILVALVTLCSTALAAMCPMDCCLAPSHAGISTEHTQLCENHHGSMLHAKMKRKHSRHQSDAQNGAARLKATDLAQASPQTARSCAASTPCRNDEIRPATLVRSADHLNNPDVNGAVSVYVVPAVAAPPRVSNQPSPPSSIPFSVSRASASLRI